MQLRDFLSYNMNECENDQRLQLTRGALGLVSHFGKVKGLGPGRKTRSEHHSDLLISVRAKATH